jgi:hypothetical protein
MPGPKIQIPIEQLRQRSVFVCTPMYGGQCAGPYTKALLDLQTFLFKYQVNSKFFFLFNESLITRARNYLADEFQRSGCTHLLFIDSDIEFNAMDVLALLAFDKPIIGGPYPKKTIAWEKIYDAVKLGMVDDNPMKLQEFVGDYVFNVAPGTTQIPLDKPCEVLEIGTGFMMVQKAVFEKFEAAYPDLMFTPDHNRTANFDGSRKICAFFDTVIDPKTNRYLSEDYMFCQWARAIGIPVWLCPWMRLKHFGTYAFGGSLEALGVLSHAQQKHGFMTPVMKDLGTPVRGLSQAVRAPDEPVLASNAACTMISNVVVDGIKVLASNAACTMISNVVFLPTTHRWDGIKVIDEEPDGKPIQDAAFLAAVTGAH